MTPLEQFQEKTTKAIYGRLRADGDLAEETLRIIAAAALTLARAIGTEVIGEDVTFDGGIGPKINNFKASQRTRLNELTGAE
jgi:hypothetical protein